jgi:hypothetical protein
MALLQAHVGAKLLPPADALGSGGPLGWPQMEMQAAPCWHWHGSPACT